MAYQPPVADISVVVTVAGDGNDGAIPSEKRITPSWSINVLKGKLETMTGIPPSSQRVKLVLPGREGFWCDDEMRTIGEFGLTKGAELQVGLLLTTRSDRRASLTRPQLHDLRPPAARPNFTDLSEVEKYVLPTEQYEKLEDSVLHWKRTQKLGRFDPNAPTPEDLLRQRVQKDKECLQKNEITVGARAIIVPSIPPHLRRGTIRYVGPGPSIPSPFSKLLATRPDLAEGCQPTWVGIELDEPTGKNDGSVGGHRYFECLQNRGVFVKPENVEVGDWPVLGLDEDLEEI
ncbi:hypothetical protein KEM52_001015 [Ascosphaera acerosa]|nr:hypothetical protein KEM52_001015 [Ascosphaera acerosa]